MTTKEFIKLFIPPIVLKARDKIRNLNTEKREFFSTISEFKKTSDTLCILGNGPSLTKSIEKYSDFIKANDCIVVNNFAYSDFFEELAPKIYCMADPNIFAPLETLSKFLQDEDLKILNTLLKKITWDISFILPAFAKNSWFTRELKRSDNINFFFYNSSDFYPKDDNKFHLWDKNYIAPPAQTVLNTCLWFGINKCYNDIYLFGADTSWIEQVKVNQYDNTVYTEDRHFYGTIIRNLYSDVEGKVPTKLHMELNSISNALKLYWDLKLYAEYRGVNVYNASEYSLVDAFERRKPYENSQRNNQIICASDSDESIQKNQSCHKYGGGVLYKGCPVTVPTGSKRQKAA